MSVRVKKRLDVLNLLGETDHDMRVALDREIESMTRKYCDKGIDDLTDEQLKDALARVKTRRKKMVQGTEESLATQDVTVQYAETGIT